MGRPPPTSSMAGLCIVALAFEKDATVCQEGALPMKKRVVVVGLVAWPLPSIWTTCFAGKEFTSEPVCHTHVPPLPRVAGEQHKEFELWQHRTTSMM
jgi:hypothetical protein